MSETTPADHLELREIRRREWGTYRARGTIRIGGSLAFKPGDPVPVGHVKRGVVDEAAVELIGSSAPDPEGEE